MTARLSSEEFAEKANSIHNNKYDYSLVSYINGKTKVEIICKEHGVFYQLPTNHLGGDGCPTCKVAKLKKHFTKTTDVVVEEFKKIHGDEYSYDKVKYNGCDKNVIITCYKHGDFMQLPRAHKQGFGCPICGIEKSSTKRRSTNEDFIKKSKNIHGEDFDYKLFEYKGNDTPGTLICNKCQNKFEILPFSHYNGNGCPVCKISKGERKIRNFLNINNIKFLQNYRFTDCRNNKPLPFDFFLPTHNITIEYDGKQHFIGWRESKQSLKMIRYNDGIKNNYCKTNNISLIRIKYTDFDRIEDILSEELNIKHDKIVI